MTREAFLDTYCRHLNDQQLAAVQTVDGPVLLLAVPGSGKTTVLVTRLGYMVCCAGIAPESILTMTYTVAATREMSARFTRLFGSAYGSRMEIRTINGLCQKIIDYCSEAEGRPPFRVMDDEGELSSLVREIYREYYEEAPAESLIRDIRTAITYCKNSMLTREEIGEYDIGVKYFPDIYDKYTRFLKENRLMDYDDQMLYALNILRHRPAVLEWYQEQYRYLCVDESQDTSRLQHEIIRLLSGKHGNLFLVGDEDQSIYGFRAAFPEALTRFGEDYPEAKTLLMERNYRSTEEIIDVSNRFVTRNRFRHPKQMVPTCGSGEPVRMIPVRSRISQYRYLFALAERTDEEITVLFRNNDSAVPLIDYMERKGIPYNCRQFDGVFFSHRILLDIGDIIRFALHPRDSETFLRIYYKLGTPISKAAALYACRESAATGKDILLELIRSPELFESSRSAVTRLYESLKALPGDSAGDGLQRIRQDIGYGSYVERNKLDAGKFDILEMLAVWESSPMALLDRLETLRVRIRDHVYAPDGKLLLSTIHSSKGLEYNRVYLLDLFDGVLPIRPTASLNPKEEAEVRQYQEERRLCYVAMTRAKQELNIFRILKTPSEFGDEIASSLPGEAVPEEDFLSFRNRCAVGMHYHHRKEGRGLITAQREELQLVEYGSGHFALMSVDEMIRQRKRVVPQPEVQKPKSIPVSSAMEENTRVIHTHYGPGIVIRMEPDTVRVRFDSDGKERSFMRSAVIPTGKLKAAQPHEK